MNRIVALSMSAIVMAGCSSFPGHIPPSSAVPPPKPTGYFVRPEFPGCESLFVPLRKRLASRHIVLSDPQFGGDAQHDYVWFGASWSLDSGFEGAFHSTLIFAKKKTESDWSEARIWEGTTAYKRPFNGPIQLLEANREFGVIELPKKRPNKAPEPTRGAVTPRAIEGKSGMAMQTEFRHAARGAPAPRVAHL